MTEWCVIINERGNDKQDYFITQLYIIILYGKKIFVRF